MDRLPKELLKTEDAVETIGGMVTVLTYVHDNASKEDRQALHGSLGYVLNALGHEVRRARKGYEGLYARMRKSGDRNSG
jgi:hypothetical protein